MLNGSVKIVRCRDLQPPTPTSTPTSTPTPSPTLTPTPRCPEPHSVIISTGTQPIGSTDPQWSLRSAPAGTTNFSPGIAKVISPHAAWSSLPTAEWISAGQLCSNVVTTDCPPGNYTYELCWQQCGALVPEPLQILADNTASVFLDSVQVATTPATIDFTTPATIPGFTLASGMHRLRVDVHNDPHNGDGTATGMDLSGTLNGSVQVFRCPRGFCVGDCDDDGAVAINELILGVNIDLGLQPGDTCPAFLNSEGMVDIAQLIKGVNNALNGCSLG